ncbi:hypothetical protein KOR42_22830 [Thalassoglobus neptunius]|uniref:Uncharacterized protein n=1 Tax=Thalassoglobus neptunius TaxID=1938619 RepID=A0A5C5X778_9PLAN|nr:hypothetical protein [Thalassoglobus neptunius]TWT58896.1 hypothetical protein KOR42_22830 [Thalassoglobus neptunius]
MKNANTYLLLSVGFVLVALHWPVTADITLRFEAVKEVTVSTTAGDCTEFDPGRSFRVLCSNGGVSVTVQEYDPLNDVWVDCEDISAVAISNNSSKEIVGTFSSQRCRLKLTTGSDTTVTVVSAE